MKIRIKFIFLKTNFFGKPTLNCHLLSECLLLCHLSLSILPKVLVRVTCRFVAVFCADLGLKKPHACLHTGPTFRQQLARLARAFWEQHFVEPLACALANSTPSRDLRCPFLCPTTSGRPNDLPRLAATPNPHRNDKAPPMAFCTRLRRTC